MGQTGDAMNKREVIEAIRKNEPLIRERFGVERLGLFGSYVKESQREQSDIDILVSFARDIDLFDFVELREFLESRLHHKVDLVMETALKPTIRKHILKEVEYV
jgi:hypothetical protein